MDRVVNTTEAALLLDISVSRVKVLLQQNRIQGATKEGRVWKIPLERGMPRVIAKNRGLKGTWRKRPLKKPTIVHVNKPQIDRNRKNQTQHPVITVRSGNRKTYCHRLEIQGSCRVIYQPDLPLSCGAVVWIEINSDSTIVPLSKCHSVPIYRKANSS